MLLPSGFVADPISLCFQQVNIVDRRVVNFNGSIATKAAPGTHLEYKVHYQNWARRYDQWVEAEKIAEIEGSAGKKRTRTAMVTLTLNERSIPLRMSRRVGRDKNKTCTKFFKVIEPPERHAHARARQPHAH